MPMLLALAALTADAFEVYHTRSGAEMHWVETPVAYRFHPAHSPRELHPQAQRDAVEAAFDSWEAVEGAEVLFEHDPSSDNVVRWQTEWRWDDDVLAMTSNWSTEEGRLLRFEVDLNPALDDWSTDGTGRDLQNALTHEVGHALGLDHALDVPEATMFPTTDHGDLQKRDLHADDEDGVRYLYGVQPPLPSCTTAPAPRGAALLLALTALGATLRRSGRPS